MTRLQPIEIVGGGLAGLSLGLALRRQGIPVSLLEAGTYPRHRVCGEFIAGLAQETIAALGLGEVLAGALAHREVAWISGARVVRVQRLPQPALGISRHRLDARLAAAFVAAGGILRERTRLFRPAPQAGRVLATGRSPGRSPWLGLKVHVPGLKLRHDLEVHLGDQCYVGLSGVEDGRVNLCGLFRRRPISRRGPAVLFAYLEAAGLGDLAERVRHAGVDPTSFSAVAAIAFARRVPRANTVVLGDASTMVPPFTGNGMAMAFQSAELAVAPVAAFARREIPWTETVRLVQRGLNRRFRVRLASASLLHPYLLRPTRQRLLAWLGRAHLLPFRPLYAALH